MKHVPIRFAVTMRMIENLEGWSKVPELVSRYWQLTRFYEMLLSVGNQPIDLRDFTSVVKEMRVRGRGSLKRVILGMFKLCCDSPKADRDAIDKWLNKLLVLRIGHNMLADQHVACTSVDDGGLGSPTGIIDLRCDVVKVCEEAALEASLSCQKQYGRLPTYTVGNYRAGSRTQLQDSPCIFTYIPTHLRFILLELFQNGFKATLDNAAQDHDDDLRRRPLQISVCRDDRRILIRIRDRGQGIPPGMGEGIWSYMQWCASHQDGKDQKDRRRALFGGGLPLCRQLARYLGGDIEIRSYPGYGTDAVLFLPRLDSELVERELQAEDVTGSCSDGWG
eukprot:CAMPEP_0170649324 /NCGR_PEP_ID=MMETSP0224-20130122/45226_1 /TAXON_ID=285029 /ORGANISM="Togula jolla, Strain CCCM 725" /LENGTH=334 /DNA_ID=CAMNT_0010980947 /DNA_START=248 /DNA_END=1252 /DNA_ORIENTATION=-